MRAREFIIEAAYDAMVDRLGRQYPDRAQYVRQMANWARTVMTKPDRVVWWLKNIEKELATPRDQDDHWESNQLRGRFMHFISHVMGIEYPPIQDYVFGNQSIEQVMNGLRALETRYKERAIKAQGVRVQSGDKVIHRWPNGLYWVYTDRAYCDDEARSGNHCGNVVGKTHTDQRIISLRNRLDQVELTFILKPNGALGEMKARGNNKPTEEFHEAIVWLLEQPFVQGIEGGGYAANRNFSLYDLGPEWVERLRQSRPDLADWENFEKHRSGNPVLELGVGNRWVDQLLEAVIRLLTPTFEAEFAGNLGGEDESYDYLRTQMSTRELNDDWASYYVRNVLNDGYEEGVGTFENIPEFLEYYFTMGSELESLTELGNAVGRLEISRDGTKSWTVRLDGKEISGTFTQ